jgi:endoglucanase
MKFFRPRIKNLKFKIKRQYAQSAGIAFLLVMVVAITGFVNFKSKAAEIGINLDNWDISAGSWKTSGDWINCDGNIDNDSAHHSIDETDSDPAHHLGMVCKAKHEAWEPNILTGLIADLKPVKATVVTQSAPISMTVATNTSLTTTTNIPTVIPNEVKQSIQSAQITNSSVDPFAGAKLYVNSDNDPAKWVRDHRTYDSYNAQLMNKIASQPEVTWLGGWNWNITSDVSSAVKKSQDQGALPVFVVYNIPYRDCGGYSAGGINDPGSYKNWISQIASTIGKNKAAVILEPDALTLMDCLSATQKTERFQMLRDAVNTFNAQSNIAIYLDAGHPNWLEPKTIASRLSQAGINNADGFALNIANFYTNAQNASYGKLISTNLAGKHFIVDTGRNGSGTTSDEQWCNPWGRSLGTNPTTNTGNSLIDAYLWIKGPGGSDGNCNGGPSAGQFWPDYALSLARNSN